MPGSPQERIEKAVEPLMRRGFSVQRLEENPESFGNTIMVLESRQYSLRILSDRGQVFVDVKEAGHEPERWYDLSRILTLEGLQSKEGPWETAQAAVDALQRYEPVVIRVLAEPHDRSRIKQLWPY
jgi:hypothetical protein